MTAGQPAIPVEVALGEPLHALHASTASIAAEIGERLNAVAGDLGVPGRAAVQVRSDGAARPVSIRVHSRRLNYPRSLDQQVLVVWRHARRPSAADVHLPTWQDVASDPADCAGVVGELVAHAVRTKPSSLLGAPQVAAWCDAAACPPVGNAVGAVLRAVLDLRLAVRERERIAHLLSGLGHVPPADAAERVVEALRPSTLEVRIEPAYLEEITTTAGDSELNVFPYLRDNLYTELGLRLPSLRLVPDAALPSRCFTFRVNDVTTPPVLGLPAGTRLVNAPVEHLTDVAPDARAALNPARDLPAATVPEAACEALEREGHTTWDPLGHLVLALAETARLYARSLVDRVTVAREIDRAKLLFPTLVGAARTKLSDVRLVRLMRALLDERVPVRDLRPLLQALVDLAANGALPESDDELLAVTRRALAPLITSRTAQRTGSILAYLLDPKLEADAMAAEATETEEDDEVVHASVVAALQLELAAQPKATSSPVLLTSATARPAIRRAVSADWPRLAVVSYDEIDAMANVMPVARIAPIT